MLLFFLTENSMMYTSSVPLDNTNVYCKALQKLNNHQYSIRHSWIISNTNPKAIIPELFNWIFYTLSFICLLLFAMHVFTFIWGHFLLQKKMYEFRTFSFGLPRDSWTLFFAFNWCITFLSMNNDFSVQLWYILQFSYNTIQMCISHFYHIL